MSAEELKQFIGRKCRCGCEQIATHVMIGTVFGKPFDPEPCCPEAGAYFVEMAHETGDQHELIELTP
jgi:hypothetical protein